MNVWQGEEIHVSIRDYEDNPILTFADWEAAEGILKSDARQQIEQAGLVFVKYLPNIFHFSCVAANADETKWVHVFTGDIRKNPRWMDEVGLCRMASARDLSGDAVFTCQWENLGAAITEYLDDQYDIEPAGD